MKKITWEQHQKNMAAFEPYSELLQGADEMEEMVEWLVNCPHPDYASEEFTQAYFKEMKAQLKWFKENVEIIVEPAKTITVKQPAQKYLKYEHD